MTTNVLPSIDHNTNRGWYPVATASDLVAGHVMAARLWGSDLVVWRDDNGAVNVWPDRCLHRGVRLSLGTNTGSELVCRYHGWRYASVAGSCTYIPAHPDNAPAQSMCTATLPVQVHAGLVWTTLAGASGSGSVQAEPGPFVDPSADGVEVRPLWSLLVRASAPALADRVAELRAELERALAPADGDARMTGLIEIALQPVDPDATVVRPIVFGAGVEAIDATGRETAADVLMAFARAVEAEAGVEEPAPTEGFGQVVAHGRGAVTGLLDVEVSAKWETADGIMAFELVAVDDEPLPVAQPGSHIDVHMTDDLLRPYSLTGGPGNTVYRIGVKREPASRGGSVAMHDSVAVGDRLTISRPRNNFPLRRDAEHTVFIAGGIGVTPLLAMAQTLAAVGTDHEFHYFVRGRGHIAFPNVIESLGPSVVVHQGLDPAATAEVLASVLADSSFGRQVYACGPGPMLDAVRQLSHDLGWDDDSVHFEYFQNPNDLNRDSSFEVALSRSARTLTVASGQTILDVLRADGIAVEASCEQGACGTCVVPLLDGRADHQDVFLSDTQKATQDRIAVCVSRAASDRLVLEL